MAVTLSDFLIEAYRNHFKDRIQQALVHNPPLLTIKFSELAAIDPELGGLLITDPVNTLEYLADSLRKYLKAENLPAVFVEVSVVGLPKVAKTSIENLPTRKGEYISFEGMVKRITGLIPVVTTAVWDCRGCNTPTSVVQEDDVTIKPQACGSCSANRWKFNPDLSVYKLIQRASIQERPDTMDGGRQPEKVVTILEGSMLKTLLPGNRIELSGLVEFKKKKNNEVETQFRVKGVQHQDNDFADLVLTPDFITKAQAFAAQGSVIPRLLPSIATSVYGLTFEKTAILLSMFGGVEQEMADGTRQRGHIHILLCGDPGTAKSRLIRYFAKLAPRSVLASGKGASAAGITAAAVKDDLAGDGGWTVEAGAMVMANGGTLFIDELDKMNDNDKSAMHDGLEAGIVAINKAGMNVTLNASCNVIAAANPNGGKFNPALALHEQLNLTPALISRFDLIFTLVDKPDAVKDEAIARHIFKNILGQSNNEALDQEFIRSYIAYARRLSPKHTQETLDSLTEYFVALRGGVEGATARQLEALVRLSEAHAKANLREVVTQEDIEAALAIHRAYLETQCIDIETGKLDLGQKNGSGNTKSQFDRMEFVFDLIRTLAAGSPDGYTTDTAVLAAAKVKGMSSKEVNNAITTLLKTNVYRPKAGESLAPFIG